MAKEKETYFHISEQIDKTFLAGLSHEKLNERLKEAYLGIIVNHDTIANPLVDIPFVAQENFNEYLVYLMSRPEYFYFIMKIVFGMESFPLQCLTLKELYTHRFPMLICTRGYSKCVNPKTMVITNKGIRTIKELVPNDNVGEVQKFDGSLLGENKYTPIKFSFCNGKKPTKIITTRSGRSIECTLNHPIRAIKDGEIVWKNGEDIKIGEFLPIVRGSEEWEHEELDKDIAYMVGAFVGDGCYTVKSKKIGFTNIDKECISNVRLGISKWNKNLQLKLVNSTTRKQFQYSLSGGNVIRKRFIEEFLCEEYTKDTGKTTPKKIFSCSFETISSYLQGLFDTDGCCPTNTPIAEFSTKTKQLAEETQMLLMCLGINSNLRTQYNKKYDKNYYKLQISGSSLRVFKDKVGFRISRKQELLEKHCSTIVNENLDLIPHDLILDKILALRELARDTVYRHDNKKSSNRKYSYQKMSPHKLKAYRQSYDSVKKLIHELSKYPCASSSKEYKDLVSIVEKNYYYDEVVSIEDSTCMTYDVELVDDHSFISNGFISHNTFLLGVYTLIKMILTPGVKCVLTGAGFRQAKLIFEVMETIWGQAPMLRNCFRGGRNGPHHGTDAWSFRLGESVCWALPIGHDGSKIRGFRANCVGRDTLIQTEIGLIKIIDYFNYDFYKVLNINNELEIPHKVYKTEPTDVYLIKTRKGYSIKCSSVHRLYVKNYGWKYAKDLNKEDFLELDNNDYFPEDRNLINDADIDLLLENFDSLEEIPDLILRSPRSIVFDFLNSLFDNSFSPNRKLTHKSNIVLSQLQILLLKFNIISEIYLNDLLIVCENELNERPFDRVDSVIKLTEKEVLYDFVMPETESFCGGGFVNHNCLIVDEKASVQKMIFEEVISGFLSVSSNPVEQVRRAAILAAKKSLGVSVIDSDIENDNIIQNQLIQSGTAYYKHNHFYEDYVKWKRIIHSGGDFDKMTGVDDINKNHLNWKDYSVLRVPVGLIPEGFMDMSQISRIKASTSKDVYLREFETIFCDDSDGFFKRSLIDFCTPSESNVIIKDGEIVKFAPVLFGDKNKKHIFGIDPAYQGDNFAVVILEVNGNHRRVIHCWTTQASDHKQMLKDFREGKSTINVENQYYDYCARKIRTLMKRFPCAYIALDAQGGGRAIMEALMDPSKLEPGEEIILPVINTDEKPQETDLMQGEHIIQIYKNTPDNITDANHALKKDMETRDIVFPHHDAISYIISEFYDSSLGESAVLYDTLEDCVSNIEELKNELSTITITETRTGKEHFDTSEIKSAGAKKGRLRKDRYSALLMANWVARSAENLVTRQLNSSDVMTLGGYVDKANPDAMFVGNSKLTQRLNDLYS